MKRAIVIGSGAGGSAAAEVLQGQFQVTVLEAGRAFHPFAYLGLAEKIKKTGLLLDERQIQWLFPFMKVRKTGGGMVLVNGIGTGGTTTLSAGNAVRLDHDLKALGLNLEAEFQELYREIPVSVSHRERWRPLTQTAFDTCRELGLQPTPAPKMIRFERCAGCGQCVLGCTRGAKWDSREFLERAIARGAGLVSGCRVQKIDIKKGRVRGVVARQGLRTSYYPADLVILAAGGLGTPPVLQRSGIACQPSLFVDPVLCVAAGFENASQDREISMPFIVQREHFIISPYFDYLSFFFNRRWKYRSQDIYSLMIKLADTNQGAVSGNKVYKTLTEVDNNRLKEGIDYCKKILYKLGKKDAEIFTGTINAGHPGGTFPLTENEAQTLHHASLPSNLYVADASLLPGAPGNPPILTIMALARRISRIGLEKLA